MSMEPELPGSSQEDIWYVVDLNRSNYHEYVEDVLLGVAYARAIANLSFYAIAKLSGLNKKTIEKIFNDGDGYFSHRSERKIYSFKFVTIKKLNDLIGKIISGSSGGNLDIN